MEARAGRLEALHSRGMPTIEKTIIQVPQPKALIKKEVIKVAEKVKSKIPVVTEIAKRGPGRPRKVVSEKINTNKKAMAGNKKLVSAKGKR